MNFQNSLKILSIILFVIACFSTLYYVYFWMPSQILTHINYSVHQEIIDKVRLAVHPALILIFAQIVLAVLVFVLNRNGNETQTNIVYVDRYQETTQEIHSPEIEKDQAQFYQEKYAAVVQKIEHAENMYDTLISEICGLLNASAGAVFAKVSENGQNYLELQASYAYHRLDHQVVRYHFGEGITGQVAQNGQSVQLEHIPENYIQIFSGLGKASPSVLLVVPIIEATQEVTGVLELASFESFSEEQIVFIEKLAREISKMMTTIRI